MKKSAAGPRFFNALRKNEAVPHCLLHVLFKIGES